MALFYSVLFILIFWALTLILPIVIVLKWMSRPVWAMFMASGLYCLPIIALCIASIFAGYQEITGLDLLIGMATVILVWLVPGFLVLILIQWRSRKRRARRAKAAIEDAF